MIRLFILLDQKLLGWNVRTLSILPLIVVEGLHPLYAGLGPLILVFEAGDFRAHRMQFFQLMLETLLLGQELSFLDVFRILVIFHVFDLQVFGPTLLVAIAQNALTLFFAADSRLQLVSSTVMIK